MTFTKSPNPKALEEDSNHLPLLPEDSSCLLSMLYSNAATTVGLSLDDCGHSELTTGQNTMVIPPPLSKIVQGHSRHVLLNFSFRTMRVLGYVVPPFLSFIHSFCPVFVCPSLIFQSSIYLLLFRSALLLCRNLVVLAPSIMFVCLTVCLSVSLLHLYSLSVCLCLCLHAMSFSQSPPSFSPPLPLPLSLSRSPPPLHEKTRTLNDSRLPSKSVPFHPTPLTITRIKSYSLFDQRPFSPVRIA